MLALALVLAVVVEVLPDPWQTGGEWALAAGAVVWLALTVQRLVGVVRRAAPAVGDDEALSWWWYAWAALVPSRDLLDQEVGTGRRFAAAAVILAVLLMGLTGLLRRRRRRLGGPVGRHLTAPSDARGVARRTMAG